ncbi:hypothetical protein PDIDSM_5197 [Penicillium digitatum]|nr:hypothetical protein PDIDSM_5197 [Penicillium digitatum]
MLPLTILALATSLSLVCADGQFRSRPDLAPPKLNITIPATDDVAPGYIFIGAYPGFEGARAGPEQPAGYIFRNNGDMVWSSLGYLAGWVGNFQAVRYKGQPVLQAFQGSLDPFHGHGYGTPVLLDQSYNQVAKLQSLTHKLISIHEFKIVNEKTALVEIYQPKAIDLTPYGGRDEEVWIVDGVFQEIDIETGKLLFEGHTLDFASPADSYIPLRSGRAFTGLNASDAWDYFHINSVDKNDEGDYLISGRHMSALYKISGKTGGLLWQLGGGNTTFVHNFNFGYQHDARFLNQSADGTVETISFFDNSARSDRQRTGGVDYLHPHSRARIVQLNHTDGTAIEVQTFNPPDLLSAPSQGNAQVLENGNVFVNWGQAGAVTEFTADGSPIFHAYLDSGILALGAQSYRGFRYEWEGYPRETPALVVIQDGDQTAAYVSWNGDTHTHSWRFYTRCRSVSWGNSERVRTYQVGEVERVSFESSLVFSTTIARCTEEGQVFAEAIDANGAVLVTTDAVRIQVSGKSAYLNAQQAEQYAVRGL